jgi:hypothetical protein
MANILIKSLEHADSSSNNGSVRKDATIIVDGAPKYIGVDKKANRSGTCYQINDLNGQLLVTIKAAGLFSSSVEFQMGDKSLAVVKPGGLLRKNSVLFLRGHEYHLPKPDPRNGHFKIEKWAFQFNDNQEMQISKPDDGKNLAALAIGYYFWTQKKDLPAPGVH